MTADRQNTPQDAPRAPVSDFQAPQAPGDATTAPDAAGRAQRYADAIDAAYPFVTSISQDRVTRVMAVADQEQAELRAEVERLRRGGAELGRILERTLNDALDASGRYDVIQEDGDGDWAVVWETLAELRPRATAAEADAALLRSENVDAHAALDRAEAESARLASVVAKVEALIPTREQIDQHRRLPWIDHNDLRAVLASVAPDTATPGEATCVCGSPDAYSLNPAEVVVHRTDGPCTVEPDASSADDKAGE